MKTRAVIILSIFMLLLSACSARATPVPSLIQQDAAMPSSAPSMNKAAESAESTTSGYGGAAVPAEATAVERLVIKNADLTIVVADPASALETIQRMAQDMGGYVVNSNLYKTRAESGDQEVPEATVSIRVPAEKLIDAMDQVKALVKNPAEDIRAENVSGQDVTQAYTDQQSRLKNLEEAEKQLREIMASATKTEDVLNVYNQLVSIREQIEVTKGQIKYYEESAALSAINIRVMASAGVAPLTVGGWQPAGVARDAVQALINALKFLANAAIWIVLFIVPTLLVISIPFWIIFFIVRSANRKRKAAKAAAQSQPEK